MVRHAGSHSGRACSWCGLPLGWLRYWWTNVFATRPYCPDCRTGDSPHERWSRRPWVEQCTTPIYDPSGSAPERCALPDWHEGECQP